MKVYLCEDKCIDRKDDWSEYPLLGDFDVYCGEIFRLNAITYQVYTTKSIGDALAKPISLDVEAEKTETDDSLMCPVCRFKDNDSWDNTEDGEEYECGNCGSQLKYTTEVTRTFYTKVEKICEIKEVKI